MFQILIQQI